MALTLISTLSAENANSYCSQAYADDYFDVHFSALKSATWSAFSDDQKTQLLIQACWALEQFRYTIPTYGDSVPGVQWDNKANRFTAYVNPNNETAKYLVFQALQFPRTLDVFQDGTTYIPPRILMAQCEQAIFLATLDETALANRLQGLNLDRVNIGRGQIEVTQEYAFTGNTLAPLAHEYIKPYLIYNSRIRRA
jgi:hypothetical protein